MAKTRKLSRGDFNIKWIETHCRVPEGKHVGEPLILREWQRRELRKIYNNPHGTRRALLSFGRKNGKSTLAAALLLLHLIGPESRAHGQLYSVAQSRDQAGIVFGLATKMVRLSPTLREVVSIRETHKQLYSKDLGTVYRALSAEVTTAFGLSPSFIIHDELGQVRGPVSELYEALETATGAQEDPLSVVISTQAPTDADLLSILIDDAIQANDPRVTLSLYTASKDLDPFDIETVKLANPAFGDFLNEVEVRAMAADASRMPARENEYRNYILNQRVDATSPFVAHSIWKACGAAVKPINDVPVYGGLDLSATQDLTALVLIGRVDNVWQVHPTFWLPADGLREKARTDRKPYDVWRQQGLLKAVPGKSIDYEFVAVWLFEMFRTHPKIQKIAFDRWNFKHFKPWLLKAGFTDKQLTEKFQEFGQGFASMSPALHELETQILNSRIAHGNHPVLSMCFANAIVQSDPAGNRKLAKNKSPGRIDGAVALAMAVGAVPNMDEKPAALSLRIL